MATPRKPRLPRLCSCGCGEQIPPERRPQARYVDASHQNRDKQARYRKTHQERLRERATVSRNPGATVTALPERPAS